MTVVLAFLAGVAAVMVWHRVALRIWRHFVEGDKSERIRKALFTKATYDSLLTIREALDAEIARRRPA